ncbi:MULTISPECIES: ATP-binding protein [Streptomyces]|uniref:Histidine kinase/HSP90-like ATPase domain-containing protein n=1 Tax=Streptomyces olivaceiscleroticus TaxID=68245 RepID=A0ABP3JBZ4_9ACTN|nr:ATP-binding protein [Streptomyces niger]
MKHVTVPAGAGVATAYLSSAISPEAEGLALLRRAVRGWLTAAGIAGQADSALLLMNELTTNAQQHAPGPARLRLYLRHGLLRCEVLDIHPNKPQLIAAHIDSERGRGLRLVDGLALAWGSAPAHGGKAVWFELPVACAMWRVP